MNKFIEKLERAKLNTPTEIEKYEKRNKIRELMTKLDGDYRFKKYIDGEYTVQAWAAIAAERRGWRQELRDLQEDKK